MPNMLNTHRRDVMTEADIMCDDRSFWVYRDRINKAYTVYRNMITHAQADSSYPMTSDGLSLAIARCHYLSTRAIPQPEKDTQS